MKPIIKETNAEKLFSVKDKVVLITGAGGLGDALSEGFAENGAKVLLASRTPGKAQKQVDKLVAKGYTNCFAYDFDQTVKAECQGLTEKIVAEHGRIDVLVNTAGIGACYPPEDFDEIDMRRIIDVNLTSAILITQAVGKVMIAQGEGKVIEIGSIAGVMTHTWESMVYESTKAAVHQMVKSFAVAWGKYNINVNAIAPTWINTPMLNGVPVSYYENVDAMHPFGRMSEPEEFVGSAIFLASDASNFITGQTLLMDGGWCAGRPLSYDKNDTRIVSFD